MKRKCNVLALFAALTLAPFALAQQAQISVPLKNVYTYSPAGPLLTLQHAPSATGNLQEWKDTTGAVKLRVDASGALLGPSSTYSGTGSYQPLAVDLELAAAAGTSDVGDTSFLAPIMGNLLGDALTKTHNYTGGVIAHFSVTGVNATTYPSGAVLAGIGDGVTDAHGAVVAYIDGDSSQTNAGAAFKVMNNNSVPGSGFTYGLDLLGATHDGFPAVAYLTADVRLSTGVTLSTGTGAPGAACQSGSVYLRSGTGAASTVIYVCGATDVWTAVTVP